MGKTKRELFKDFRRFHRNNPEIYKYFKRFSFEVINKGRTNFSVSMIIERIRWETFIKTSDVDFKISNNHRAYYSRLFMAEFPRYRGFFRTTKICDKLDKWINKLNNRNKER